jgi:pyruvate dehydrogenase E1 component alpha subunit
VSVAVFGDGATEEGVYHESLNFAALHRLPVLFLCEDNGLAVHSPVRARQAYDVSRHAEAYGIPVRVVRRGNDALEVFASVTTALRGVRNDGGPALVVCHAYRHMEHVGIGDDHHVGYRSPADAEEWRRTDPLFTDDERIARFAPAIEREIDDAVAFAEASPWPGPEHLLADVA